jgi:hypothetical protein
VEIRDGLRPRLVPHANGCGGQSELDSDSALQRRLRHYVNPKLLVIDAPKMTAAKLPATTARRKAAVTAYCMGSPQFRRAHVCKPSRLPPRDCSAQALLKPHKQ